VHFKPSRGPRCSGQVTGCSAFGSKASLDNLIQNQLKEKRIENKTQAFNDLLKSKNSWEVK
jgi:hypothetical protein